VIDRESPSRQSAGRAIPIRMIGQRTLGRSGGYRSVTH
jgi:hypothetical protein